MAERKKAKARLNKAETVEKIPVKINEIQNLWAEYGKRLARRELLTVQAEQLRLEAKAIYEQIQKLENK